MSDQPALKRPRRASLPTETLEGFTRNCASLAAIGVAMLVFVKTPAGAAYPCLVRNLIAAVPCLFILQSSYLHILIVDRQGLSVRETLAGATSFLFWGNILLLVVAVLIWMGPNLEWLVK